MLEGPASPSPLRGGSGRRPGVGASRQRATSFDVNIEEATPPGRFATDLPSRGR